MPNVSYKSKQMIVMRRDLKMRKGKIAAQAGHACVEATLMALAREGRLDQIRATQDWVYVDHAEQDRSPLTDWFDAGVAKVCVYVDGEEALLDLAARGRQEGFAVALIRDAGMIRPALRQRARREARTSRRRVAFGPCRNVNSHRSARFFLIPTCAMGLYVPSYRATSTTARGRHTS